MRKRVYISGNLTTMGYRYGNLKAAEAVARELYRRGYSFLCPHLSILMDGASDIPHDGWMEIDLPWVEVADAVFRISGMSRGADRECAHARKHSVPVVSSFDDLDRLFEPPPVEHDEGLIV